MSQNPNVRAQVEPTELGANASETGERDLTGQSHDAYEDHEVITPAAFGLLRMPGGCHEIRLASVTP